MVGSSVSETEEVEPPPLVVEKRERKTTGKKMKFVKCMVGNCRSKDGEEGVEAEERGYPNPAQQETNPV